MKEFCRKGHMKGSGKRWLAILMSICLIGTMIPISARAETDGTQKSGYEQEEENVSVPQNDTKDNDSVDGEDTADNTSEPGDDPAPSDDEPTCTCSERCTEDHLNSDCPVCGEEGAGLSQCEGKEQTKPGEEQTKPGEEQTKPDEKQNAECTCSELCTEDNINTDCPVCGADDADLYDCKGKPDENDDVIDEETLTITAWEWIDEEEYLDPETGSLALPFANKEHPAYFDDITAYLPTQILATVENTEDTEAEEEDEAITLGDWSCDNYPEDGAYTGSYTFTATLPEGYALSDEAEALEVLVELGGAQLYESTGTGDFTVTGGTLDTDYTYENNVLTIKTDKAITIANTDPTTPTTDRIMVASGISANITLAGVNIDVSSSRGTAAFKIEDDSIGNVTITLADGSENTLKSGRYCAGLQKNGNVEGIGKLTIQGGENGTGKLNAKGGMNGAGIGGGNDGSGSNIEITDGTVTATGGFEGAGIGGSGGTGSDITISGGTVTATGGINGAGIGGGSGGTGSDITISDGTVTATGGDEGAGIGGGSNGSGSKIKIRGGTVTATGDRCGAGIGGGYEGSGSDIEISGGNVIATGASGAGIGGGYEGSGSDITISGGTVTANGGNDGAGIGGGSGGTGSDITISGGTVTATSDRCGAGIGGGMYSSGSNIKISGGSVKAGTGANANAIGGGERGNGAVTPTSDGTTSVYLFTIENPDNKEVLIDGVSYTPVNHKVADGTDGNLYAYLTGKTHEVKVGEKTCLYVFDSDSSTFAVAPLTVSATNGGTLTYGTDYTYENNVLTIKTDTPITIKNTDPSTATTDRIMVADGVDANITLAGVNIDVSSLGDTAAFKIADLSDGNVTITLADGLENTLESGRNCAGLQKKGNTSRGTLTIQGGTEGTGRLTATGRENGAGIGGGCGDYGIGTSSGIKISGGTVTAKGGKNGAGIGGGWNGSGSNITISGGTVTAIGGLEGAGIGGGWNGSGSNITISGGTVTAKGGENGAGIGGGCGDNVIGKGSDITISSGTVTAKGGENGAGIGGGWEGSGSNITISGGTVTATSKGGGAGIGGGYGGSGSKIKITGGSVKASGANAIGSDSNAVPPTSDGTTPVYLLTIANSDSKEVLIDGGLYTPVNHKAVDVGDGNLYAYLPAKTLSDPLVVKVGAKETKYIYDNSKWRIVPTVTAPTPNELAYTGEDQALVAAGTTSGGTMVYSLREYDMYTETIPTGTGAGTYTVWYKVEGNEDYAATLPASVSVTIAKASTVITNADTVRNQSTVYGSGEFTAPVAEVTGTVTYKVGETTYDAEQLKTYLAGKNVSDSPVTVEYTFKPTDTTNYKEVTGTISFTITQATPEITWSTPSQSAAYTGSEIATGKLTAPTVTLVNSETYTGTINYSYRAKDSSVAFTSGLPTDLGTYEVIASIAADGNYTAAETTSTMTLTVDWLETGEVATLKDQGGNSLSGDSWWAQSVTFTAPADFTISNSVDGIYGTSFVYDTQTGAAGTTVTYYLKNSNGEIAQKTATVRIDRTAPTWPENGGITIKANWWKSLLNTISFGLFYKDATLDVKASAADDLSGVASYYYYVDTTGNAMVLSSDELANRNFTEKAGSGTQTLKSLSVDRKYVVYAYAVDAAGNKSGYVCTNGVVLDRTAPTISGITTPSKEALTLTDTSAKISFTGSEAGTCFYMVKKISEPKPTSIDDFATSSEDKGMTVWTAKTGVSSVEMTTEAKQITLSNLSPNTKYNLYLAAVDQAGNSSLLVISWSFTTCKTMPTITTNPSISGIYGQKVEEMTLADGVAKVGSEEIRGTWELTDSNKANIPEVGTTDTYQVTFKPDASYNDNYDTVIVPVKPTVSKRAITVTADDKTKTYGQANPAFTYAITEGTLVDTDTKEALGITLTCAANASSPVKAGGYAITGTTNSANYQVTVIPGVLTIEKATPTITASNYTKTYGDIKFFLNATDNSAEASLQYAVTESKDPSASPVKKDAVVTVDARGYVTIIGAGTAKITASLPETANYNAASKEIAIVVNQAAYPPNRPGTSINASNRCNTVGDVPLPSGWAWQESYRDKELTTTVSGPEGIPVEIPVSATAVYIGADKTNYINTTVTVSITRSACDHIAGDILYTDTGNGEKAPTCTVDGKGHRECTICHETIESGIVVKAAHKFSSAWTIDVAATTTSEGSKSHHCSVCGEKNDVTVIPKLVISGGGDSGNAGDSSDNDGDNNDSGNTGNITDLGIGNITKPMIKPIVIPGSFTQEINLSPGIGNNIKPATNTEDNIEEPFIKGENGKEGWDVIRAEVNQVKDGDTVTVDMNGAAVVPSDVLSEIKGKDITIVFDMGNGITWSVNGQSITGDAIGDIDFSVTTNTNSIPVDIINNITGERYSKQISLSYDGEFGFTAVLSINMEAENAGLFANLFYYNENTGEMEFICYDEIAADGTADLTFTHASDYAIVIDTEPMDSVSDGEVLNGETDSDEEIYTIENDKKDTQDVTEADSKTWNPWWVIIICIVVIVITIGAFIVIKKKKSEDLIN